MKRGALGQLSLVLVLEAIMYLAMIAVYWYFKQIAVLIVALIIGVALMVKQKAIEKEYGINRLSKGAKEGEILLGVILVALFLASMEYKVLMVVAVPVLAVWVMMTLNNYKKALSGQRV